jgi:hypothetical protein
VNVTDEEAIEVFERGEAPGGGFHHADHVRVAFAYLGQYTFGEAAVKFSEALRRFARARGKPQLYHETITWAYLVLIHERMARAGRRQDWKEFADENPDLLVWRGGIVERSYRAETLASELAREVFVLPDRK